MPYLSIREQDKAECWFKKTPSVSLHTWGSFPATAQSLRLVSSARARAQNMQIQPVQQCSHAGLDQHPHVDLGDCGEHADVGNVTGDGLGRLASQADGARKLKHGGDQHGLPQLERARADGGRETVVQGGERGLVKWVG